MSLRLRPAPETSTRCNVCGRSISAKTVESFEDKIGCPFCRDDGRNDAG